MKEGTPGQGAFSQKDIAVVRQQLEVNARAVQGQYWTEYNELRPEAQDKLVAVVKPWWQSFERSGLYTRLYAGSGTQKREAYITDDIVYPVLRAPLTPEALQSIAGHILAQHDGDIEKAREAASGEEVRHDAWGNLWKASFFVAGEVRYIPKERGFRIGRFPLSGMNWIVAMGNRKREIPLRLREADGLIAKVHPEVILGLAEQTESGRVDENIEELFNPPPTRARTARVDARREHDIRQGELARQYWAKKQARRDAKGI